MVRGVGQVVKTMAVDLEVLGLIHGRDQDVQFPCVRNSLTFAKANPAHYSSANGNWLQLAGY